MALKWKQLVDFAGRKRGWSEDQLREKLQANDVSSANITNWKAGRALPPSRYQLFADVLETSVDEVSGRKSGVRESTLVYGERDDAAAMLAAEIAKLDPAMRDIVSTLIEVLVAKQKRESRKLQGAKRGESRTTT